MAGPLGPILVVMLLAALLISGGGMWAPTGRKRAGRFLLPLQIPLWRNLTGLSVAALLLATFLSAFPPPLRMAYLAASLLWVSGLWMVTFVPSLTSISLALLFSTLGVTMAQMGGGHLAPNFPVNFGAALAGTASLAFALPFWRERLKDSPASNPITAINTEGCRTCPPLSSPSNGDRVAPSGSTARGAKRHPVHLADCQKWVAYGWIAIVTGPFTCLLLFVLAVIGEAPPGGRLQAGFGWPLVTGGFDASSLAVLCTGLVVVCVVRFWMGEPHGAGEHPSSSSLSDPVIKKESIRDYSGLKGFGLLGGGFSLCLLAFAPHTGIMALGALGWATIQPLLYASRRRTIKPQIFAMIRRSIVASIFLFIGTVYLEFALGSASLASWGGLPSDFMMVREGGLYLPMNLGLGLVISGLAILATTPPFNLGGTATLVRLPMRTRAFASLVPQMCALLALYRLLFSLSLLSPYGYPQLPPGISGLLVVMAATSIGLGLAAAHMADSPPRIMAATSATHTGLALAVVGTIGVGGQAGQLFMGVLLAGVLALLPIYLLNRGTQQFGNMMVPKVILGLAVLTLWGVPPLGGFVIRLDILSAISQDERFIWLGALAGFATVLGWTLPFRLLVFWLGWGKGREGRGDSRSSKSKECSKGRKSLSLQMGIALIMAALLAGIGCIPHILKFFTSITTK